MMKAGVWLKKHRIEYKHLPKEERLALFRKTPVWCEGCYDFRPHFHPEELDRIKCNQKPKRIFSDSLWDWNCEGITREWIEAILAKMKECPQHTFQILSKRPARYSRFSYPPNVWLGTSISTNADKARVTELCRASPGNLRFVSVEPLHEELNIRFSRSIDWIILGAETGSRKGKIVPERKWVQQIIVNARKNKTPIFIKDNVKWNETIREFPTY
jgi:protein gp37